MKAEEECKSKSVSRLLSSRRWEILNHRPREKLLLDFQRNEHAESQTESTFKLDTKKLKSRWCNESGDKGEKGAVKTGRYKLKPEYDLGVARTYENEMQLKVHLKICCNARWGITVPRPVERWLRALARAPGWPAWLPAAPGLSQAVRRERGEQGSISLLRSFPPEPRTLPQTRRQPVLWRSPRGPSPPAGIPAPGCYPEELHMCGNMVVFLLAPDVTSQGFTVYFVFKFLL